ncbi:MAG TPA: carbohydrate binding family 9 domain-containing protein, partial [Pyrinomonadaceae bacterium]|nr:carbohydrate binding family 9 domain-containing protein [Pyrinomonadaceae bacterium]
MRRAFIICIVIFLFALDFIAQTAAPTPVNSADTSPTPEASQPTISTRSDLEAKRISEDPPPNNSHYVRKDVPARIPRFEAPPVVDGQLNDAVWRSAAIFGDFLQTNPGDNIAPVAPTEVMMGYDAKNLYIAFHIKQDRDKIRATVARRDNIFNDDYVGFYIDTFNDRRQAYCIFLNPLGVQADGVFTENNGEDYSVDLVMESKGILTPDGYTIELAIPFKSLRYEAGKDKNWGLHLFRRIKYNNNELDSWMRNNRSESGSLSQAGLITGLEGIETTRQLEISPSFTLSESGRRTRYTFDGNPAGRYVNDGVKG